MRVMRAGSRAIDWAVERIGAPIARAWWFGTGLSTSWLTSALIALTTAPLVLVVLGQGRWVAAGWVAFASGVYAALVGRPSPPWGFKLSLAVLVAACVRWVVASFFDGPTCLLMAATAAGQALACLIALGAVTPPRNGRGGVVIWKNVEDEQRGATR